MDGYVQRTRRPGNHMSFHSWLWEYIGGLCTVTGQGSGRQTILGCYGASWLCALQVPTSWDFPLLHSLGDWGLQDGGVMLYMYYTIPQKATFPQASPPSMPPSFAHSNYFGA